MAQTIFDDIQGQRLPTMRQGQLIEQFHTNGASATRHNYDPRQQWVMMPDIAAIMNHESRVEKTLAAHFRTNAHMLGSEATKWLTHSRVLRQTPALKCVGLFQHGQHTVVPESCPACMQDLTDDAAHALLRCPAHASLRRECLPHLHQLMRGHCAAWDGDWATAAGNEGLETRCRMVLQSANMLRPGAAQDGVSSVLTTLLSGVADQHPTYRKFNDSRGTAVQDYYKLPGM
jgi:hypothetical protein